MVLSLGWCRTASDNTPKSQNCTVHVRPCRTLIGGGDKTADHKYKRVSRERTGGGGEEAPGVPFSQGFQAPCLFTIGGQPFTNSLWPIRITLTQPLQAFLSDNVSTHKSALVLVN